MPFWFALLLFSISTVLGQLFRPKTSQPKPATLAELDFPTAEETRCIPKGYGTFLMKAPNVVSVTDFSSEPIKSKVSALQTILSFGAAKKQTIGFKYFCGIEMALSYRLDALVQIIIDDKVAWSGEVNNDGEIYINQPNLFGGDDSASGGNGGVQGFLGVHLGLPNAQKDAYLVSEYGNYTAHRGVAYVVWKGQHRAKGSGYLGNSANVAAWQFVGRFIPNNLPYGSIQGFSNYSNINNGDANPAEVLYDIIRNSEYAIGMPASFVNLDSFTRAAKVFYDDGIGFSALWDSSKPCKDIINGILQLTDSVLFSDLQTGQLTLLAARADYDVNAIPHYTDADIVSISSYTRGAWAETTNYLTVPFVNRLDGFIDQTAPAIDLANQKIQQATIATNVQHVGISNPTTAANIAQRDLKAMTTPLAKATFEINLKGYKTLPGKPFKLSTKRITDHNGKPISGLVMRCNGIKIGNPRNPIIQIEAVEDLFNSVQSIYAPPPSPGGGNTSTPPVASGTAVLDELPFMLAANDLTPYLWIMAAAPNSGSYTYDVMTGDDGVQFDSDEANNNYAPTGVLNADYGANTSAIDNSHVFVVTGAGSSQLDKLTAATASEIANGKNLMLVVEGGKAEIMAFESFTVAGNNYTFNNVWRGLLDTVPQSFTSAARVWFFSYGDARTNHIYAAGATGYAKILTRTLAGILDAGAAAVLQRVLGVRSLRPYAPGNIRINGVYNGAIPAAGTDVLVEWSHRDRTRQGTVLAQNAGTVGLEGGANYVLKIYNENGSLLRTVPDIVGESYTYTNAQESADNGGVLAGALSFVLYAERAGITSYQAQIRKSTRGAAVPSSPGYAPGGAYTAPPTGDANSIGGVPVTGTPSNENNTPVYDPATGTITWQPGGGVSNEVIQDMIATFLQQGSYVSITYNDPANKLTIDINTSAFTEYLQDMLSLFFVNGSGINGVYDDASNTYSISLNVESVQDIVAAFTQAGTGISVIYNDAGNVMTISLDEDAVNSLVDAGISRILTEDGEVLVDSSGNVMTEGA